MKIVLAERTGFCFGVKRAVAMAEALLGKNKPIYSLGSIIHNKQVVRELSRKGLRVVKNIDDIKEGVVVVSSHGISPKVARAIAKRGIKIIDTTCPFVMNAQKIAKKLNQKGSAVVIVGDSKHPEVKALVDFAPKRTYVVKDRAGAARLEFRGDDTVSVISQTTQSMSNFLDVVRTISIHAPKELAVFNTICKDAEFRQDRARRLAKKVGLMLVVGGRDSANTKRLFEVCRKVLNNSHLLETENDLRKKWFKSVKVAGITSGASTPDWVIKNVVDKIIKMQNEKCKTVVSFGPKYIKVTK